MDLKRAVLAAGLLCLVASGMVRGAEAPSNFFAATATATNDYVFTSCGHTGEPSLQLDLTYSRLFGGRQQHRGYIGLWGATGGGTWGDEIDLYAGTELDTGRGTLTAELFGYNVVPITAGLRNGDAVELGVKHLWKITPQLRAGIGLRYLQPYDIALAGQPLLYGELSWTTRPLPQLKLEARQRAGYDWGIYGYDEAWLTVSRLTATYSIDKADLTTLGVYVDGTGTISGDSARDYYLSIGISFCQMVGF